MNQSDLWTPRRRIEQAFRRALRRISQSIDRILRQSKDIEEVQDKLLALSVSRRFLRACEAAAMTMVTGLFADQGIPPTQREMLPVLRVNGKAAAVPEIGVDRTFLPEEKTNMIWISFHKDKEEKMSDEK